MEVIDLTGPDERILDKHDLQKKEMKCVLMLLNARGQSNMFLNSDNADHVLSFLYDGPAPRLAREPYVAFVHPASVPPRTGRCMILELPEELRRIIFTEWLPAKNVVIEPVCREGRERARDLTRKPRRNKTSDLLTLNKTIKNDMQQCVYAERTFAIHVHEGFNTGGIEFLDSGRQPLQYKEDDGKGDDRFARFENRNQFGFHELKKIEITIFPPIAEKSRHSALNTFYMNKALACMLERSGEAGDIVSLSISFASVPEDQKEDQQGRCGIMRGEHWWWDPELDAPRETSIHNVTDIELALRPFAILTHVHNVSIHLPSKVKSHPSSVSFANNLKASMSSRSLGGTLHSDDRLEYQAEAMRGELFEYIYSLKWGGNGQKIARLDEEDMFDDTPSDDEPDSGKHDRSFSAQNLSRGVDKRAKLSNVHGLLDLDKDDEDMDVMSFEMQQTLMRTFEKGNMRGPPKMGSLSSKKPSTKPSKPTGITPEEINQAFDEANDFTFLSDFADETKFDSSNNGTQLGSASVSGPPPPGTDLLRSLRADIQQTRRRVKAVELRIDPGVPGPQPVDSAIAGIFSDGSELLNHLNSDTDQSPGTHSAVPSPSSNSLLQTLNIEREQRRQQQRYSHLDRGVLQSNEPVPLDPGTDLSLTRVISNVRQTLNASNFISSRSPQPEVGDKEDNSAPSDPYPSAHKRIDSCNANTTTPMAEYADADGNVDLTDREDDYDNSYGLLGSDNGLDTVPESTSRPDANRVTKPNSAKKKQKKSSFRTLTSLFSRGVNSTALSGRKSKSYDSKSNADDDENEAEEDEVF